MELKTPTYINGHYAAQNREEMGVALSKNSCELDSAQFEEVLDVYDQGWHTMPSWVVPKPDKMIAKLLARKDKKGRARVQDKTDGARVQDKTDGARVQEDGIGECCKYLNELMGQLPST